MSKDNDVTKPLFVPLNSEHYDNFLSGSKTFEMRQGPQRWNDKTVYTGRQVLISKGYGKKNRMIGNIGKVYRTATPAALLFRIENGDSLWSRIFPNEDCPSSAYNLARKIYQKNGNFIAFECLDLKVVDNG